MKKKLILLFFFSLLLILSCNNPGTGGDKTQLVVWAYERASETEFNALVSDFEAAYPNVEVQLEKKYDTEYHDFVVDQLSKGVFPDIGYMGSDFRWGAPWRAAGQFFDHNTFIDKVGIFDKRLIPPMDASGHRWYIPLGTPNYVSVLFANRALIESLGLSMPASYDDIKKMAATAQAAGVEVLSVASIDNGRLWPWGGLLSAAVGKTSGQTDWVQKAVEGTAHFTDSAFTKALAMIETMVADNVLAPGVLTRTYEENLSIFSEKKALFMLQGQWAAHGLLNSPIKDDVDLLIPLYPGIDSANPMFSSLAAAPMVGYGMTLKASQNPDVKAAAENFLQFFNSEARTLKRLESYSIVAPILENYTVPPALPRIIKQKLVLTDKISHFTDVIDAIITGAPNDAINNGCLSVAEGLKTPAAVGAEVEGLMVR